MGKLEKTLNMDLDELSRKIDHGVCSICSMTIKRDEWSTEAGDVKCIVKVFEKCSNKKDGNHASMAVTLVRTGDEVRLCAITSGTSNALFFIPYDGCEGELSGALGITLNILDDMIL